MTDLGMAGDCVNLLLLFLLHVYLSYVWMYVCMDGWMDGCIGIFGLGTSSPSAMKKGSFPNKKRKAAERNTQQQEEEEGRQSTEGQENEKKK